jgi:hypothetical protein
MIPSIKGECLFLKVRVYRGCGLTFPVSRAQCTLDQYSAQRYIPGVYGIHVEDHKLLSWVHEQDFSNTSTIARPYALNRRRYNRIGSKLLFPCLLLVGLFLRYMLSTASTNILGKVSEGKPLKT